MEYKILNIEELSDTRAQEIDIESENKLMKEIISKIKRTMKKNKLTSLSAPAIGYNKRIFCIDFSDSEIKTFINPLILQQNGIELVREVCSSLPGKEYIHPRNKLIDIIYQRPDGIVKQNQFSGMASTVIQHELDHLNGITIDMIGLEVEEDFDKASKKDKFEIIDIYLKSLKSQSEKLNDDIKNDDVLRIVHDEDKAAELIAQGKIEIEPKRGKRKK